MAQLSADCFAHGGGAMTLDEALAAIAARVVAVTGTETVATAEALGRILADDLVAAMDVPPHANAAVDGYAVYRDDLAEAGDTLLPITGRVAAGHPLGRPARRGEALRIFTGAPMPEGGVDSGPDTVFMQEDCAVEGDRVRLPPGMERGANRRAAGEDVRAGAVVLPAGRRLRPEDLGLAAAVGAASLAVRTPLRVALFSTGDELREPGTPLDPGAVYDSNRYTLSGLLRRLGCRVTDLGILRDRAAGLGEALARAAPGHDLLITSGGVSVGEEDHVRRALESVGAVTFWRLRVKPGRPVALGHVLDGGRPVPIAGLPGNPVAVMVTFLRLVRPLVLRLAGAVVPPPRLYPVHAGFEHHKKAGRREWLRCRLESGADGPVAVKSGPQGAGILSAVAAADGLVELPEELTYVGHGSMVEFLPFSEVA